MKKINCIIADDEALAREVIESHAKKIIGLNIIATCTNGTLCGVRRHLRRTIVDGPVPGLRVSCPRLPPTAGNGSLPHRP